MTKLTEAQRQKISETVAKAEQKTCGQIVPMIAARSDSYPEVRWSVAVSLSLLSAVLLLQFKPLLEAQYYLLIQFPFLILGHFIGSAGFIQRLFLAKSRMNQEVHQHAVQAFFEHGLVSTKHRTGVLIMVSVLERRVQIIADAGINSKVDEQFWNGVVERLILRVQKDDLIDGLCEAISECGELLASHFPKQSSGGENELSNEVVVED